jgi:hypothetical protein
MADRIRHLTNRQTRIGIEVAYLAIPSTAVALTSGIIDGLFCLGMVALILAAARHALPIGDERPKSAQTPAEAARHTSRLSRFVTAATIATVMCAAALGGHLHGSKTPLFVFPGLMWVGVAMVWAAGRTTRGH